jgi:hypothetical protein
VFDDGVLPNTFDPSASVLALPFAPRLSTLLSSDSIRSRLAGRGLSRSIGSRACAVAGRAATGGLIAPGSRWLSGDLVSAADPSVAATVFFDADAVVFVSCTSEPEIFGSAHQLRGTVPAWLFQAKTRHLGAKNLKRMKKKSKPQKPKPRPLKLTHKP